MPNEIFVAKLEQAGSIAPTFDAHPLNERASGQPPGELQPMLSLDSVQPPESLASQDVIALLCKAGLRRVHVRPPLFGEPADRRTAIWFRILRDLGSCAVEVEWQRSPRCAIPVDALRHLPAAQGEDRVAFGSLYWRLGPGFVTIRDARGSGVRLFVLDDPESRDTFLASVGGVRCEDVPEEASRSLQEEGLVVDIGGTLVALPYRMRHWPVPFRAI